MQRNPKRRSTSFTKAEIELAHELFQALLVGQDVSRFVQRPEYRGVTSRFLRMREAVRNDIDVRDVARPGNGSARRSAGTGGTAKAAAV